MAELFKLHGCNTLVDYKVDDLQIWNPAHGRLIHTLQGHRTYVGSVAWDASGQRLASGSGDQTVKIWDPAHGQLIHTLAGHAGSVRAVAWIAKDRLVAGTGAGTLELWDLRGTQPRRVARIYEAAPVRGLVATPDGYVDGPPAALDGVRFADGWALYDLSDVPERHSPERVRRALASG